MVEVGNIKEMVGDLKEGFAELRREVVAKTASNGEQNTEIAKVVGRVDVLEKEKDAQNKRIAKWVGIIALIIALVSNLDKLPNLWR